jgi:hypothetical protein
VQQVRRNKGRNLLDLRGVVPAGLKQFVNLHEYGFALFDLLEGKDSQRSLNAPARRY